MGGIKNMKNKDLVIIINAAKQYSKNLENNNILIIYLNRITQKYEHIELLFQDTNFLHLTGVEYAHATSHFKNSKQFYDQCINGKLNVNNINYKKDGTTRLKLDILPQIMNLHKTASMIGDFNNYNIKLETDKIYGTITACLGAVQDNNGYFRPNTAMKIDIRDITVAANPIKAIYVKNKNDSIYSTITKSSKDFKLSALPNNIKRLISI